MGKTGLKPIRLKPVYKESIWAGERLKRIRDLDKDRIGISREVCAYRGSENEILEGEFAGQTIDKVIKEHHQALMGEDSADQLVRAAYMDTAEDLSIQVHPNEIQAAMVGDYEKSESWYIVEADEGAYITAGVSIQDKEELRRRAESGELDECLVRLPVKAGDFAMIPAGMVHACGKNMLALEVGSFGGITYRLYDYGRGRPLDLDKGFEIVNPTLSCEVVHSQEKIYGVRRHLVKHELFQVEILDIDGRFELEEDGQYRIISCVEGACTVVYEGERYSLDYIQTLFVPAECGVIAVEGTARILISRR